MDASSRSLYISLSMRQATDANVEALLADLNEPQKEAVLHTDGPLLVLAGPGSGKTRVITRRAAQLARTVTEPRHVLAITFTNKAAREMAERIEALGNVQGMTVSTFHALCARLLRIFHEEARVSRSFTIFDRDDRRKVLKEAIAECGLSNNWTPARIEPQISNAKNAMLTPEMYEEAAGDWSTKSIARVYALYEDLMRRYAGLDFDDLLMRVAMLLARNNDLRDRLENRYRYVLIDEYQDTNAAQYQIARLLTEKRKNLCATGDPDQSIYGWRGADIENILRFERDFPDAKVVRLEQNYRSTGRILAAAGTLIASNLRRKAKTLWTENEEGAAPRVILVETGDDEARVIAEEIEREIADGAKPGDIAVFYRINALSRPIEEAFLRRGIRYQVARGVEFYNRKEIKDVLAYLRVLVNPADDVSLLRIINTPGRGIGAATVKRLSETAKSRGESICTVITGNEPLAWLGKSAERVRGFVGLLNVLRPAVDLPPRAALEHVISHSGLRAMLHAESAADADPLANVDELVNAAAEFEQENPAAKLVDWLEHAALIADVDQVQEGQPCVTLMTLHAAKGLEFPVVFIIGLEDGLLPFRRSEEEDCDEEEERRLCFVGMTRAMRRLTLSHARYRLQRGRTARQVRSPLLDELPDEQVEWCRIEASTGGGAGIPSAGRHPADFEQWEVGTLVRHPILGLGQIRTFRRGGRNTVVDVRFQCGAEKTFTLEYSPLERVDFDEIGD